MTDSPDAVTDSPDGAAEEAGEHAGDEATDATTDATEDAADSSEESLPTRSAETDEFWSEVRVDPVRVALPGMVGYTLRAYRPARDLALSAASTEGGDEDIFAERERARAAAAEAQADQEEALTQAAVGAADAEESERSRESTGSRERRERDEALGEGEEPAPEEFAADEEEQEADESPAGPSPDEEVPVFLSRDGRLLLFSSAESLVAFLGSDESHDLAQLDTWSTVVDRARAEDIAPRDDDSYELDLVVENLRGGHDAWDLPLLISAGEFARDVGWALRLTPVMTALSPGSPLDDLDEALRAAAGGGISGFFARRRLRRIGAQQASLGWRTAIGKITGVVDWRD